MIYTKKNLKSLDYSSMVEEVIRSAKPQTTLFVVPTNRLARNLKKRIISEIPGSSISTINIETLTTLSMKLLEEKMTYRELSDAGASVLLKHIASNISLRYFRNYKESFPDGTLDRIRNVIGEYKEHGITPELLRKEAETLERSEKLKAQDIADIYEKYNEKISSLKVYELGDIYANLNRLENENIVSSFKAQYPEVRQIFFSGFDEFTAPEVQIIDSLSNISGIESYINFDYYRYNPMIFSHLDKSAGMLEMFKFNRVDDLSPDTSDGFTSSIRERLFLETGKKIDKFKDRLFTIKAFSKSEEVETIAAEIKELLLSGKSKPNKICVAFNLVGEYTNFIREKFELYGIPSNITDRPTVDSAYPVIAFINFLEIIENNYYFKNVLRALNSGFLSLPGVDPENLKRAAAELKIVSGKETWLNKLNSEIYLTKGNSEDDFRSLRKLNSLEKALADFKKIEKLLRPFEKKLNPATFSISLLTLINELKIKDNLLSESYGMEEENIKAFTAFLETVKEIAKLTELEFGNEENFPLQYYLDSIRTASGRARYNVKEKSEYGVLITGINEIRGLNFDYLFLGGMNDGIFPTRFQPEIFLSGSFKRAEIIHQTEERFHFYQALSVWRKALYLSSSFADGKRELVESSFVKDFTTLFETSEISANKFIDKIYNNKKLQIEAGEKIKSTIPGEIAELLGQRFLKFVQLSNSVYALRSGGVMNNSPHNGFFDLNEENLEQFVELSKYKEKQFSISRLETYAKCPFKFYLDTVLNIEIIEEPTDEVEAMELGSIFHEILYRFLTEVRKRDIKIAGCDDKTFFFLLDLIFDIAEEEITKMGMDTPVSFSEKERITGYHGNRTQSVLYRFLDYERNLSGDLVPSYFEVSFGSTSREGTDESLSFNEPVVAGNVKLRGKIDRIDINESENSYDIVDYKLSGKKPTSSELQSGISLQLPVYLYAAQKILASNGINLTPNDMVIYSLKYSTKDFGKNIVKLSRKKTDDKEALNEEIITNALNFISDFIENISSGKFNLSPFENRENLVCGYCNYKPICRITDLKEEN